VTETAGERWHLRRCVANRLDTGRNKSSPVRLTGAAELPYKFNLKIMARNIKDLCLFVGELP
jgi:hypothetical protein